MDDPNAEYMTGVKERFERNKEIFAKLISGESEAGENYYQKGTDGAKKLQSQLNKTFGDPMKSKLSTFVNSLGDIGSQLDNLAINTITKLEDSLFTFLTEGKFKFKEFADSIIKQIIRMAIKQMIFNILAGFTNRNAAASAPVATPTTTKNALGNTFANGIQPFARGGIVTKPTLFRYQQGGQFRRGLMAEAGPEAIMPLRRGPSGRLGVEAHGGGTNISIAVDAKGSRVEGDGASAKRLGNAISEAVRKEIVHQQRPGGLL
jgi:phage-related minor tail protein